LTKSLKFKRETGAPQQAPGLVGGGESSASPPPRRSLRQEVHGGISRRPATDDVFRKIRKDLTPRRDGGRSPDSPHHDELMAQAIAAIQERPLTPHADAIGPLRRRRARYEQSPRNRSHLSGVELSRVPSMSSYLLLSHSLAGLARRETRSIAAWAGWPLDRLRSSSPRERSRRHARMASTGVGYGLGGHRRRLRLRLGGAAPIVRVRRRASEREPRRSISAAEGIIRTA